MYCFFMVNFITFAFNVGATRVVFDSVFGLNFEYFVYVCDLCVN